MVKLSQLKDAITTYISTGTQREEVFTLILEGHWGNTGITEDISNWRLTVSGYNPLVDKSGMISKFDIWLNSLFMTFGMRKVFSVREDEVVIELKANQYSDPMIAFFLERSLQEVRIRLMDATIKDAISNYNKQVL